MKQDLVILNTMYFSSEKYNRIGCYKMKLTELLSSLPFYETTTKQLGEYEINMIQMDHRKIQAGDLFVCIKGFTVDGHDFAEQAIENGAQIIIAEKEMGVTVPTIIVADTSRSLAMIAAKFFQYPSEKLPLIGITGTNGKTTTSYLLEAIFSHYGHKTGLIGTIQMKIGDQSFPVNNTTPDSLLLQKTFKQMVDESVDIAMMEVSSHALDMGRVNGTDFDVAVYTNLSQDHLDYHKDMDDYAQAKSLLFSQLGNNYRDQNKKYAIINEDDSYRDSFKRSTAQHVLTYGCEQTADIMATNINLGVIKTSFTLETPVGKIEITSHLIGLFNVYNMLAASSVAIAFGVPLTVIKEALEGMHGVDGRFEQVVEGQGFGVIVDYAHTPDSLENVLQTIREFSTQKVYVVVGCGGDRDRAKRPLMANMALKYADKALFTADNPRTEDPDAILEDMTKDLEQRHYEVIPDRKEAIQHAIQLANDDDIILIAGKGHETYQEINRVKYDFDDRKIARAAIHQKENN